MADFIRREAYRIGYLSQAGAVEVDLPYASVVNKRGRVTVGPCLGTVLHALLSRDGRR